MNRKLYHFSFQYPKLTFLKCCYFSPVASYITVDTVDQRKQHRADNKPCRFETAHGKYAKHTQQHCHFFLHLLAITKILFKIATDSLPFLFFRSSKTCHIFYFVFHLSSFLSHNNFFESGVEIHPGSFLYCSYNTAVCRLDTDSPIL